MKNVMILLLIPMLLLTSCGTDEEGCATLALADGTISDLEEYAIVEAVLNSEYAGEAFYHIDQESLSESGSESIDPFLNNEQMQFDSMLIEAYVAFNNSSFIWSNLFEENRNLLSPAEFDCYFEENGGGWKSYYDKYEDSVGVLQFGRPVQNDNGEAIIVYNQYCGWLCGYGFIAILEKVDGEWVVKKNINTWIS